jgi:uncharacterized protein (DUF427 family)
MKAVWKNTIIGEAPAESLIQIEGDWYFHPKFLEWQYFEENSFLTGPTWQGEAGYYNVVVDGEVNELAAWYYPVPKKSAVERVGANFANYVAFRGDIKTVK